MKNGKDLGLKVELVDRFIIGPSMRFINNSSASGIVLFSSAFLAILLANSPWSDAYHSLWKYQFSIGLDGFIISKDLHHWINDGLMAVFFFVVGLELKREIIGGGLSDVRSAVLPIGAAVGGMDNQQLKRLKELVDENRRLKRMFADLSLDHQLLKEVLEKKF